jgi:DHA2 family multidrug resistance protein
MADVSSSEAQRHINPWLVAFAVMFGTFMEVLDTPVVNVALPHIAGSMSATVEEATWSLTSYLVANAIILPMTGWLASVFGRKRLVQGAVVGFTVSSILCGFAPNLPLLVFRIIQGATGGTMQPLSQAIMLEAFPPKDRGKAMGFWGLGIVVAPMLGPVLGGWLTDNFNWRWVFYINLPVGLLASLIIHLFVFDPPHLRKERTGVDYWGIGLLTVGVGALQIMLDKGQQDDWLASNLMRSLLVITVLALTAFVVRELTASKPIVDLRVFSNRTYSVGVLLITMVGVVLYGSLVLLPVFLQTLFGYPALQAGIAMAPRGLGSFLAMPIVGLVVARVDPRKLLATGIAGAAWTLYDLSRLNLEAGYWDIFWPQLWQGISLALLFVPLTTTTMDSIAREEMGNATSSYNFMRNIGGSFGIALSTTLLARSQQTSFSRLGEHVTPYYPASSAMIQQLQQGFIARGSDAATALAQAYAALGGIVQRQAYLLSFIHVFQVLALVLVAVLPLLLMMRRPRRGAVAAGH